LENKEGGKERRKEGKWGERIEEKKRRREEGKKERRKERRKEGRDEGKKEGTKERRKEGREYLRLNLFEQAVVTGFHGFDPLLGKEGRKEGRSRRKEGR
jgi:hypothetical protein